MAIQLTRESIINLLMTNDAAVCRALIVLNNNQTADEQQCEATTHHNNRGFQPSAARMGTSMAKFYLRNKYLSQKQINYWRKPNAKGTPRIGIYWKQLIDAANAKKAKENQP